MAESTIYAIVNAVGEDLAHSWRLLYRYIKGSADWIGYLAAGGFYVGKDLGYGNMVCKTAQIGYQAIYYLGQVATFGQGQ